MSEYQKDHEDVSSSDTMFIIISGIPHLMEGQGWQSITMLITGCFSHTYIDKNSEGISN